MNCDMLTVNEIFFSIEGEGRRAGKLAAFIRLTGCNLRCSYCDTEYAFHDGKLMGVQEIAESVQGWRNITLTGGEPLLQNVHPLFECLSDSMLDINVETNGSIDITKYFRHPNVFFTVDYKCPSSGMEDRMAATNLRQLRSRDCLKFVVGSIEDLEQAKKVCRLWYFPCPIYISPVFGKITPAAIVDFIKDNRDICGNWRVQLQLHKYIWDPLKRGV